MLLYGPPSQSRRSFQHLLLLRREVGSNEREGTDFTSEGFWLKLVFHLCVEICINLLKIKWKTSQVGMDYINIKV